MPKDHNYYTYIVASVSGTLYTGVTNNLERRMTEHKQGLVPGFTQKYSCNRLIYYEHCSDIHAAISREKQIKNWRGAQKEIIIKTLNPAWQDLSAHWNT